MSSYHIFGIIGHMSSSGSVQVVGVIGWLYQEINSPH